MIETVYLDSCVLNRPSDDLSQPRIRLEVEAISRLLDLVYMKRVHWVTSTVVQFEILRNPDPLRRVRALDLLTDATVTLAPDAQSVAEASRLAALGIPQVDALHLAIAHTAGVDWLITTDDRFARASLRLLPESYRPVIVNPVDWMQRRQPWLLQP